MKKVIPIHPAAEVAVERSHSPWRASRLLSAPHRLGFFAAALMFSASGLWWAGVVVAGALDHSPGWALPAPAAHAVWMGLGFMPLFLTGFWFTAGPRWLGLPEVDARSLRLPIAAMLLGWAVAVPGFHVSLGLVALGLALGAAAWSTLCWRFAAMLKRSRATDKLHASGITLACWAGAAAWWLAAGAAAAGQVLLLRSAAWFALWGFAATAFAVASHRMLPFFEAGAPRFLLAAWSHQALLWMLCSALWIEGGLSVAGLWWWPMPPVLQWARVVFEVATAGLLLWLALRRGILKSLRTRLLVMLHVGFVWLGLSFALAAVSQAGQALAVAPGGLGLAPVHAMTMGYLGSTLIAMVARVTSGHSGRAVVADTLLWRLHWLLQAAVLLRVLAALWPAAATPLVTLAALAWCAVTTPWALRYGRWLGQSRSDGRPG